MNSGPFLSDLQVDSTSHVLKNKKIMLCGGGGIAALELPKIARELRRHGAEVRCMVTENALRFVGRESLEWATGRDVLVNPTGFAEHICTVDAAIIVPTTANLIAAFLQGICPDGVTTFVQSALGSNVPVLVCPTMHESLIRSPIVEENYKKLLQLKNIYEIPPRIEEGKFKAPEVNLLVREACHLLNKRWRFADSTKRIAVTYGGTRVLLDPVRCLTNLSTGALGLAFVDHAHRMGLSVTPIQGSVTEKLKNYGYLHSLEADTFQAMHQILSSIQPAEYEGIFHLAAVSDFIPEQASPQKISSQGSLFQYPFTAAPKFITMQNLAKIKKKYACKLTSGDSVQGLSQAQSLLTSYGLNAILWNDSQVMHSQGTQHLGKILWYDNSQLQTKEVSNKQQIAFALLDHFLANP